MADDFATLPLPTFTETVDQQFLIEPLSGPSNPTSQLDRFPDELYDKTPNSHFVRFMYTLLGPAGIGWLRKNLLTAKLAFYAHGFDTFDMEKFYGNPFGFPRVLAEVWETDPLGLLPKDEWDAIRARDESYRNRAITFFNAARAGNTPLGMQLAAQSGLNHEAEVIENYKYLFDAHSDEPLDLPFFGSTTTTEEFVIIPRRTDSQSEVQVLTFEDSTIANGTFFLTFNGQVTDPIPWNANFLEVQTALRALGAIGDNGVQVTGGECPNPFYIQFSGALADQNVSLIEVRSSLVDDLDNPKSITVTTYVSGVPATDEVVNLSDEFQHNMETAVDFLRPVNTIPSVYPGTGTRTRQDWKTITATSEYSEVIKYVTGSDGIQWPANDGVINWIEEGVEKERQRIADDLQHLHISYNVPRGAFAYTDAALDDPNYLDDITSVSNYNSEHVGQFGPDQTNLMPLLRELTIGDTESLPAGNGVSGCPTPLQVTAVEDATFSPVVNDYLNFVNVISIVAAGAAPGVSVSVSPASSIVSANFGNNITASLLPAKKKKKK
jgi:hypothetical protein